MSNYATRAYASVGVNTAVEAATPHKLILMLYDGLLKQIRMAKIHMQNGEIARKATCIARAISIIDQGLRGTLDLEKGGELGMQLFELYQFSERRLLHANMRNDVAALDEVARVIEPLRAAWAAISPDAARPASGAVR